MNNECIQLHCNGRAWSWLRDRTSDPAIQEALSPDRAQVKEVGNGVTVHLALTRLQAEQAIAVLEDLESQRAAGSLPQGTVGHDDLTFTNAIKHFRQCLANK